MTSAGYQFESPESRTLGQFTAEKFTYRDQGRNLIELNNAVGYMSAFMRKMQQGIDDANQNVIQQLQSFITDFIVLLGGGGDTGLDFGDLRYVIGMIGSLFGFTDESGNIKIPPDIFGAAWHLFSTFIFPAQGFVDVINIIIDAFIATSLDLFGEVPILGQALQQFAVILSTLRDIVLPLAAAVDALFGLLGGDVSTADLGPFGPLYEKITKLFGALTDASVEALTPIFELISTWTEPFIDALVAIVNILTPILEDVIDMGGGLILSVFDVLTPTLDILAPIADLISIIVSALTPILDGLTGVISMFGFGSAPGGFGAITAITNFITNHLNPSGLVAMLTGGFLNIFNIPGLDASKIISGFFPQSMINGLTSALSTFLTAASSLDAGKLINLVASLIPGLDASKIISGLFPQSMVNGLVSALSTFLTAASSLDATKLIGLVASLIPGLDASKIISGIFPKAQVNGLVNDLNNFTNQITSNIVNLGGVVDSLVQGILGGFGTNFTTAEAKVAVSAQSATVAQTASAVAAMLQNANHNAQGGNSAFVDFGVFPDSTTLPSIFTQTTVGSGSSTFGIISANAGVASAFDGAREWFAPYNVKETLGDDQIIGIVIQTVPESNDKSYYTLEGRSNGTTTRVEMRCYRNKIVIGTMVAGVWTQWFSLPHVLQAGSAYYFAPGTAGGHRIYQIICNTQVLYTFTEIGTVSQLGASYRKTGIGVFDWGVTTTGTWYDWIDFLHVNPHNYPIYHNPGFIAAWSMADNAIPTFQGSCMKASRHSTTGVAVAGSTQFPAGLLDTLEYITPDITWNGTTATVTKEGPYIAAVGYKGSASLSSCSVFINGVLEMSSMLVDHTTAQLTAPIYLRPGDAVRPAAFSGNTISGDIAGKTTYFSLVKVG